MIFRIHTCGVTHPPKTAQELPSYSHARHIKIKQSQTFLPRTHEKLFLTSVYLYLYLYLSQEPFSTRLPQTATKSSPQEPPEKLFSPTAKISRNHNHKLIRTQKTLTFTPRDVGCRPRNTTAQPIRSGHYWERKPRTNPHFAGNRHQRKAASQV